MTTIEILSDPICPWCLIGKTMFERALAERPGNGFQVTWHPFQLNPKMPPEGMGRDEYLEAKFGGKKGAYDAYLPIVQYAEKAGVGIDFEAIKRTPNTMDAHRLIHWAGLEGHQAQVVDALFDAFFRQGKDISQHEVLIGIASAAGMDADVVQKLLESDADKQDITRADIAARNVGIRGVPCFIVGKRYAVQGAQPTETWLEIIDEILAEQAREPEGSC